MTQSKTYKPTRQVGTGAGIGVSAALILAWVFRELGVTVPPEVVASAGALLNALATYVIGPDKPAGPRGV